MVIVFVCAGHKGQKPLIPVANASSASVQCDRGPASPSASSWICKRKTFGCVYGLPICKHSVRFELCASIIKCKVTWPFTIDHHAIRIPMIEFNWPYRLQSNLITPATCDNDSDTDSHAQRFYQSGTENVVCYEIRIPTFPWACQHIPLLKCDVRSALLAGNRRTQLQKDLCQSGGGCHM